MNKVKKAIFATTIFQVIGIPLGVLSTALISRMLTPEEIGVHVVATAIAAIATEIRMLGTGGFLIRKKELLVEDCQRVLGVTLVICWVLGALLFLCANLIAESFNIPELGNTIRVLTLSFFVAPFISLTTAVLSREFKFKITVTLTFVVAQLTFLSSLLYIWLGFSYLSLAMGLITGLFFQLVALFFLRPQVMSWRPKISNPSEVLKFGGYVSGASLFRRFSQSLPDLIIGKLGMPAQAAMFSRGLGLMDFTTKLIFTSVNPIVMPYLSDVKRNAGDDLQIHGYLKASQYYCSLVVPMCAVAGIAAYPAIMLIFGGQWLEAVGIAKILAVWVCITSLKQFSNQLLITSDFEKKNFYLQLTVFIIKLVCCSIGFLAGLEGVAYGLVCAAFIELIIVIALLERTYRLSVLGFLQNHTKNILVTMVCCTVAYSGDYIFNYETVLPIYSAVGLAVVMPITWLISIWLIKHDISTDILNMLPKKIRTILHGYRDKS